MEWHSMAMDRVNQRKFYFEKLYQINFNDLHFLQFSSFFIFYRKLWEKGEKENQTSDNKSLTFKYKQSTTDISMVSNINLENSE